MELDRVKLLEQKVDVINSEFNQVIGEMQTALEGLAKLATVGLKSLSARLEELEKTQKSNPEPRDTNGVEL